MAVDSRLVKVLAGMYKEAQLNGVPPSAISPASLPTQAGALDFGKVIPGWPQERIPYGNARVTLPGYEYLPDAQLGNATPTPLPARGASMSRYLLPAAAILAAIGGGAALASRKRKQEEEKQRNAL